MSVCVCVCMLGMPFVLNIIIYLMRHQVGDGGQHTLLLAFDEKA